MSHPHQQLFTHTAHFPFPVEELYRFHSRPGALERLLPPWDGSEVVWKTGSLAPGGKVLVRLRQGPFAINWEAHHIEEIPGLMFRDVQHRGPFSVFRHTHTFTATPTGSCLTDSIEFALPGQRYLPELASRFIRRDLQRIFSYREHVLREDLALHGRCSVRPLRLLITGASGVLGRVLVPLLTTGGHEVWTLVRRPPREGAQEIFWDPWHGKLDPADLPELDGVIHLAGEYIGLGRWTEEKKLRVVESRTRGTGLLARTIARLPTPPRVLLSASAVGYYGDCGDRVATEEQRHGNDFISHVCTAWENSVAPARQAGIRTVLMRLGVALTPLGGALERLLLTHPMLIFRRFGHGNQYVSWISIDDMVAAMLHCLVNDGIDGAVNIAAPTPVTNRELLATLARVTNVPQLFSIPPALLRMCYGQMANEVVLSGCRVAVDKLERSGFLFRHPTLEEALTRLLGKRYG